MGKRQSKGRAPKKKASGCSNVLCCRSSTTHLLMLCGPANARNFPGTCQLTSPFSTLWFVSTVGVYKTVVLSTYFWCTVPACLQQPQSRKRACTQKNRYAAEPKAVGAACIHLKVSVFVHIEGSEIEPIVQQCL